MSQTLVFELVFTDKHRLEEAFGVVYEHEDVLSCSFAPDAVSARFMAGAAAGATIVERIYLDGGLRWCSRHAIGPPRR